MNGLTEAVTTFTPCLEAFGIFVFGLLSARGLNRVGFINRNIVEPLYMRTVSRRYEIGADSSPEQHEKYTQMEFLGIAIRFLFGDPHRHSRSK